MGRINSFERILVGFKDEFGRDSAKQEKYVKNILSSQGTHKHFEKAEHFDSLSRDEKDEYIEAARDYMIYEDK